MKINGNKKGEPFKGVAAMWQIGTFFGVIYERQKNVKLNSLFLSSIKVLLMNK